MRAPHGEFAIHMQVMRNPGPLVAFVVSISLTGCLGLRESQTARERASADLSCPESQVHVDSVPGHGYVASGCGGTEQLTCMTSNYRDPIFKYESVETSCMGHVENDASNYGYVPSVSDAKKKKDAANDEEKAHAAYASTVRTVLRSIPYRDCGSGGTGKIELTIDPTGLASEVSVVEGDFDAPTATCISERFHHVRTDAFAGDARTFRWKIDLQGVATVTAR